MALAQLVDMIQRTSHSLVLIHASPGSRHSTRQFGGVPIMLDGAELPCITDNSVMFKQ